MFVSYLNGKGDANSDEGKFALSKMQMNNNWKIPKEIGRYMILDKID
jgi:hypothetical protein